MTGPDTAHPTPSLGLLPNGSILLKIPALPVGSQRTDVTLTIAYRGRQFIVAGFAYEYYDYLNDTADGNGLRASCDYNLLTGKGNSAQVDKQDHLVSKAVAAAPQTVAFKDWNFSDSVQACGNKG